MTKGVTAETVDGMSLAKIDRITNALRCERFRWTPVRRVNIPKLNDKNRASSIPTWTDKMLQEVIRMTLEAYYDGKVFRATGVTRRQPTLPMSSFWAFRVSTDGGGPGPSGLVRSFHSR